MAAPGGLPVYPNHQAVCPPLLPAIPDGLILRVGRVPSRSTTDQECMMQLFGFRIVEAMVQVVIAKAILEEKLIALRTHTP